jgi:hypothetical protein
MNIKFNRKAYMNKECTLNEYYDQFVTDGLVKAIGNIISINRIQASQDEHFNDIPLREWDALEGLVKAHCGSALADSNASTSKGVRSISLSDCVCVAKVAAMRLRPKVKPVVQLANLTLSDLPAIVATRLASSFIVERTERGLIARNRTEWVKGFKEYATLDELKRDLVTR